MPELRKDPVSERWVILSEERGRRPSANRLELAGGEERCPFCPGNEVETLPEILAIRSEETVPDSPGWSVRVVPNRYPALRTDAAPVSPEEAIFQRRPGFGRHEVIIEGDTHTRHLSEMSAETIRAVVDVYRRRFRALAGVTSLKSAVLIKNVGLAAGASIEHSHSQLIGTPVLPPVLAGELLAARRWSRSRQGCMWCATIRAEQELVRRVVALGGGLVALCPWASRFPYEIWILPVDHESHFESTGDAILSALADLLPRLLRAVMSCLPDSAYNYVIQSAPFPTRDRHDYHWRLAILPRVTRVAGYEQATGLYINPVSPEHAAAHLRQILQAAGNRGDDD